MSEKVKNCMEEDGGIELRDYDECCMGLFGCRNEECVAMLAERAIALKRKFEGQVLLGNCYRCGKNALAGIVDEFNKSPALLKHLPEHRLAKMLEYRLFYKMLDAVETGGMTRYITFLFMYYQGYIDVLRTGRGERPRYFTSCAYIKSAKVRARPQKPVLDLEVLTEQIGGTGPYIYEIVTGKDVHKINSALEELRQSGDRDYAFEIFKVELASHCLFELYMHGSESGRLPKYLQAKILLLKLMLEAKEPHERRKFWEKATLPRYLTGKGCGNY